jgi:hypothetical protein
MPVQTSIDILESVAVPPAHARAIVQANQNELAGAKDTLATKQDIHDLKQDIHNVELKIEATRGDLRAEIHASATNLTRHMYTALFGQTTVILGIVYFIVSHSQR